MNFDLSGVWTCNDGGIYYLRQIGSQLYWGGLNLAKAIPQNGLSFSNVYFALINALEIQGDWADVPRGSTQAYGTLSLTAIIDGNGNPLSLTLAGQTGGFSGSSWTFVSRTSSGGVYTIQDLFDLVSKSDFSSDLIHRETLANGSSGTNLHPVKDATTVVFGRLSSRGTLVFDCSFPSNQPRTLQAFWDLNSWYDADLSQNDADSTFNITISLADNPGDIFTNSLGNFFSGVSQADINTLNAGINGGSLGIHCEMIMFGYTDGPPYVPLLPGWADTDGNSVLINGRPLNGDIVILPNDVVGSVAGQVPAAVEMVRVSGALVFDEGHGSKGIEIHPVYAVDFVDASGSDALSGAWATSDGGTCYLRQIYNSIWFLWMRPYRDRAYGTVFRGTRNGSTITGTWADIPLGNRASSGSLTLTVSDQNLRMAANQESGFVEILWQKLYDTPSVLCPVGKVDVTTRPLVNCMGIVLEGSAVSFQAKLVPQTYPQANYVWNIAGAVGVQTSPGVFEVVNTPPAGNTFTITVTAIAPNGCEYTSKYSYKTGTLQDVTIASELCALTQALEKYIHSIYPAIPFVPYNPGDPFYVFPSVAQTHEIQQFVTRIGELLGRLNQ